MKIDWEKIDLVYSTTRRLLFPIDVIPQEQVDKIKLAALSEPKSTRLSFERLSDAGLSAAGSRRRRQRIENFNKALECGMFEVDNNNKIQSAQRSCFHIIEKAIAERRLSTEFLFAWGQMYMLVGEQIELLEQDDDALAQLQREINSGHGDNVKAQRYWFAKFVTASPRKERDVVENRIRTLCTDILSERRQPPADFPPEWFEKLLAAGKVADVVPPSKRRIAFKPKKNQETALKSSFTRLGWDNLIKISNDPNFQKFLIPPIRIDDYSPRKEKDRS